MSEKHLTTTRFDSFPLSEKIMRGVKEAGFTYCTPIQEASLPLGLEGKDIAGQAQTGTGKTAAFLLATFENISKQSSHKDIKLNQPRALILAPTRELAIQIYKDALTLAKYTDLRIQVVYGGTGYEKQKRNIEEEGVDILIGTPGRLIDYFKQKIFKLRALKVLVMDEADRMFDLGFIKDIRFLIRRCPPPKQRISMLFSATLSYRVTELAYEHMNNPQKIIIESEQITAEKIKEIGYMVANEEKISLLLGLLNTLKKSRSIIFINTKREADKVWGFLEGNGYKAAIVSGDVPQKKREALLKKFASNEVSILVATDVAARGLHIEGVTHVFNYDLPEDSEDYVHRIGRTARAGAEGDAISFVCETYAFSLPEIESFINHKIPIETINSDMLARIDPKSRIFIDRKNKVSPQNKANGKAYKQRKNNSR